MLAIDLANAVAEFEPYWFEEPCQSENVKALAEVRRASRIPVVTGVTGHFDPHCEENPVASFD